MQPISIIKADGEREEWNPLKLLRSLTASGADDKISAEILHHVEKDLKDGMRTQEIYRHAFTLLRHYHRPTAAQYSLKRALMEFGPSGFPFERFVAELLKASGYRTQVGVMVRGACVEHEVDVIAENDQERIIVEAKFHNAPEIKSDVKVALYVKSRFEDIVRQFENAEGNQGKFHRVWLITNTNFTSQAIQYGRCAGLAMTGWNYPNGRTLQDLVRETRVHPMTVLTTLSKQQKLALLERDIVLCGEPLENPHVLREIGIPNPKHQGILNEGRALCPLPGDGIASSIPSILPI
jgi:Holliday junction resolvase-like predicted endonuclease